MVKGQTHRSSLQYIQELCQANDTHTACIACPLHIVDGSEHGCAFASHDPCDWDIERISLLLGGV
jgi:hypothetical protein